MGAAESKTEPLSSSSGPNSRGAEVPLAKEEQVLWKIENISTMLQLAKDTSEYCSMAKRSFTKYEFEIEPQSDAGWTKWRLLFSMSSQPHPAMTPSHFSLYLEKDNRAGGAEDKKVTFDGDVLVKMELLPDSKLPWPWTCCSPPKDPFGFAEKSPLVKLIKKPSELSDEASDIGWPKFLSIDTLNANCPGNSNATQSRHLPTKSYLADNTLILSLKLTFQYLHVSTTSRQLSTYDVLASECDNEFRKAMESLFEQNVKVSSSTAIRPWEESDLQKMGNVVLSLSGKFITVQKCFLGARSPALKTMVEGKRAIVEIPDIKYEAMLTVLEYIYTGKLPISGKAQKSWKKYPGDVNAKGL